VSVADLVPPLDPDGAYAAQLTELLVELLSLEPG
jgi:hypothetical protein